MPPPLFTNISDRGENAGTDFNQINILPEHLHLTVNYNADSCWLDVFMKSLKMPKQGRIQGGGAPGVRPLKSGKNMIVWRKIVIFHTKYLKKKIKCAPP